MEYVKLASFFLFQFCGSIVSPTPNSPLLSSLHSPVCPHLNETECQEFLSKHGSNLYPILQKISTVNFPSFTQLDTLLLPFLAEHCHITISNFQSVDVPSSVVPFVLRKPEVGLLWGENTYRDWVLSWVWLLDTFRNSTGNLSWLPPTSRCKESTYYAGPIDINHFIYSDSCILLNPRHYFSNTKPWNCQVELGVYPPNYQYNFGLLNYPRIFFHSSEWIQHYNIIPTQVPSIHFWINHELFQPVIKCQLISWMETIFIVEYGFVEYLVHDIFLLVSIMSSRKAETSKLSFNIIQYCHTCEDISRLLYREIDVSNLTSLLSDKKSQGTRHLIWGVKTRGDNEFLDKVLVDIFSCKNLELISLTQLFARKTRSEQVEHAYATVWTSIMENYTFNSVNSQKCVNGKLRKGGTFLHRYYSDYKFFVKLASARHYQSTTGGHLFAVDLPNSVDRLKFVTCGEYGFDQLPFEQLLSVFHLKVWILILVSIVAVTCSIYGLLSGGVEFFAQMIFISFKVLLEQGTPFYVGMTRRLSMKIIVGTYILVAVVMHIKIQM